MKKKLQQILKLNCMNNIVRTSNLSDLIAEILDVEALYPATISYADSIASVSIGIYLFELKKLLNEVMSNAKGLYPTRFLTAKDALVACEYLWSCFSNAPVSRISFYVFMTHYWQILGCFPQTYKILCCLFESSSWNAEQCSRLEPLCNQLLLHICE